MGTLFVDTGGSATNSGSTDQNAANLTGAAATAAAAVITLDGSPDLSGLSTSGANQSTIFLGQATNSNQKIFWITAVDNVLKTVTVSVAPTGITSSSWAIGGRFVWTPASVEAALRAGDTVIVNNDIASSAAAVVTARTSGDSTSGPISLIGKTGVRPKLTTTGAVNVINGAGGTNWRVENLELIHNNAAGNLMTTAATWTVFNCKLTNTAGVNTISNGGSQLIITMCEIFGGSGDGISSSSNNMAIFGNYIHDVGGDGIEITATLFPDVTVLNNVIANAAGRGIFISTTGPTSQGNGCLITGNTVYNCGNSGLEVSDTDTVIYLINNIFQNNGNAAGEFNVEWAAGAAEFAGFHAYNCFNTAGAGGSGNVSGLTINATEITTDPLFVNAGAGDFSLQTGSPVKAAGIPGTFLNGPVGYRDMGAVQSRASGFTIGG